MREILEREEKTDEKRNRRPREAVLELYDECSRAATGERGNARAGATMH